LSEFPYHPDLKVTETGGQTKVRRTYLVAGLAANGRYQAYNNTIRGMARAVNERLFYVKINGQPVEPPNPEVGIFDRRMREFSDKLDKLSTFSHPMSREAFASCFHGRKKERYETACEVLGIYGIRKKDAHLKFFMKFETYDFVAKPNPVPRGINPRSDQYLVEFGRYIRPIEKLMYRNIASVFGYTVVMKGLNQAQRGKLIHEHWTSFRRPRGIMIDASRFEQSVLEQALRWTHGRYSQY